MSEPIGGELSTLSTGPTVRTSVETTGGVLTPQTAREGDTRGESEGGKKGEPAGPLDPAWARALASRAACQLGRCAYVNPAKPPNRYLGAQGCDGYSASRGLDPDGRPVVRWGLCPRHRAWWKLERIRRSAAGSGA